MRTFYQVYMDGSINEILGLERCPEPKRFYAELFNVLGSFGIERFKEDSKQYVFHLRDNVEVKVRKYFLTPYIWIQISAEKTEDMLTTSEKIIRKLKEKLTEHEEE